MVKILVNFDKICHHFCGKFRIDATFEIRTSEYVEICISIDHQKNWREGFYVKQKEGERKQGSGETERARACVCVCVDRNQRQR